MAYGWTTTKTVTGFNWSITRTTWSEELQRGVTEILKSGTKATRAQASGIAKKWVVYFRRGGAL